MTDITINFKRLMLYFDKMRSKRKSYFIEYKKEIVEESRGKNITPFL